nr:hypothetical protein KPHV_47770 [Kitasatospora purpeofusca]
MGGSRQVAQPVEVLDEGLVADPDTAGAHRQVPAAVRAVDRQEGEVVVDVNSVVQRAGWGAQREGREGCRGVVGAGPAARTGSETAAGEARAGWTFAAVARASRGGLLKSTAR